MSESFPRLQARTRRFTLGAPRGFTISPDGARVAFLRSQGGTDPVTCLWVLERDGGGERLVADPRALGADEANLPPEERARRERSREQAGGIVGYACDAGLTLAAFTLAGRLHLARLAEDGESPRAVEGPPGVIDPRPDPAGTRVAYVSEGALWLYDLATGTSTALAEPESPTVRYGLADFVAAEEMSRMRGYWWSPTGDALLVARVDDAAVHRWHIADPARPEQPAAALAYPAAGTPNAVTELYLLAQDGRRTQVAWRSSPAEPYLAAVTWDAAGLVIAVQPRDQRELRLLRVDPVSGGCVEILTEADPRWVDIVPGVPAYLSSGALVWTTDADDARRLVVDGALVTPPTLKVRSVLDTDGDTVLFSASEDATESRLWTYRPGDGLTCLTPAPGVFGGRRGGNTTVIVAQDLDRDGGRAVVHWSDGGSVPVRSLAESPGLTPRVTVLPPAVSPSGAELGARPMPAPPAGPEPRVAVLLPTGYRTEDGPLPVLMDPYGGPHAQRVLASRAAFLTSQWFADQGFAVVVADGRGTPGRGPSYERAVYRDLATPVLEDQVSALSAASAAFPGVLDLGRVGIRGWSFGGYLAALAVLRRPDVFHAAVAGAPVTDWSLYDTHYTERYLGTPEGDPEAYRRSSLLSDAAALTRPLLLIHGLVDDNVVAAHTLRLSSALLAAGRPHSVLPLSGVTHMTPQEEVAENLLLLQVDFLRSALGGS
ncbi:prolyl oligopeptidase family serine peptidase [Pseudonocardia eucalypti]|uniref:Prolyl oligopeptidase family serine peptidase n=1 Tax=Pseudonocardia eucalypti TaxID=648755 RepID=A0ABP9R076_9PSEU|nr:dipeptidyl-peptidase-4 [Pseudonocardia eucalypti]